MAEIIELTAWISAILRNASASNQSDFGRSPRSNFLTSYTKAVYVSMIITTRRSRIRERRVPRVCDTAVLRTTITTLTLLSGSIATYSSFASLLSPCFYFTTMAASRGDRKPYNVSNPLFNVLGGPYSLHSDLVLFLCYSNTILFILATEPSPSRCKR